ncbi:MAG: PIG-L deacetylase family protein [Dehalococcoidia bacterium]
MVTQTPLDQITDAAELFGAVEPKRAMVIMAHPDDCEFMCGGTVAMLTAGGWEVDIVVVTSGNKGTKDPTMTAQRLAGTREEEQRAAARILGAREPVFLGYHDGSVLDDDELRETVVYQLRRRRPELVITWDGFRPGFNHRDHRNVGRATYDAIYPAADDHLYHPEHKLDGLQPHRPRVLLLGGTNEADLHVDIERVLRRKVRAVLAHTSQMRGRTEAEMLRFLRERARAVAPADAISPNVREAFRKVVFPR